MTRWTDHVKKYRADNCPEKTWIECMKLAKSSYTKSPKKKRVKKGSGMKISGQGMKISGQGVKISGEGMKISGQGVVKGVPDRVCDISTKGTPETERWNSHVVKVIKDNSKLTFKQQLVLAANSF